MKRLLLPILLLTACLYAEAADGAIANDSLVRPTLFKRIFNYFEASNDDHTLTKKIDFSIIGGPHYASDVKFGIGVVAAGIYRTDRSDPTLPISNVSLYGDLTTTGFYLLGVRGNNWFKGGRYRIDYNGYFYSMPGRFYARGFEGGENDRYASYQRLQNVVSVDLMARLFRDGYVGSSLSFAYNKAYRFKEETLLDGAGKSTIHTGLGLFFLYDSRDLITAPSEGVNLKLEQRIFPNRLSNTTHFWRTEVTLNGYQRLWWGAILAGEIHALFNWGEQTIPWSMNATLGGSYRMRGYFEGRYRNASLMETQVELRQKIYKRNGLALWVGAGNVFSTFNTFAWNQTLPNYGIGYRWEFKKGVNVRLDYGFGKKGQSGFIFGINEAF